MKTIVKEIHLLDIEDIEKAVFDYLGEQVSIKDMSCSFVYYLSGFDPNGMGFTLCGNGMSDYVSSYDLFYDEEKKVHYLNGKRLILDEPWLPVNEVFNFDTSVFSFFESYHEDDD